MVQKTIKLEVLLPRLVSEQVAPGDVLSAAATFPDKLPVDTYRGLLADWVGEATFLSWSKEALNWHSGLGNDGAVTYAKRAVCRRIDALVLFNYLYPFSPDPYPAKIAALRNLGVTCPDIVHELVITPRNELEHGYAMPTADEARHAVEVAQLFLESTGAEIYTEWRALYGYSYIGTIIGNAEVTHYTLRVPADAVFLFVDCFDERHAVKIINGTRAELLWCYLDDFTRDESLRLARECRQRLFGHHAHAWPKYFYELLKTRGRV